MGGLYLLLFKPVKSFMEKREKHYADMEAAAVAREKDTEALKAPQKTSQLPCAFWPIGDSFSTN